MDLSPEGKEAVYFGAFYLYRDVLVTAGVFLGGWLWIIKPELNLIAASCCGLGACLIYGVFGRTIE